MGDAYLVCEDVAGQDLLVAFASGMGLPHGKIYKVVDGKIIAKNLRCEGVAAPVKKENPF